MPAGAGCYPHGTSLGRERRGHCFSLYFNVHFHPIHAANLRYGWIRRSTDAAASQLLLFVLGGNGDVAGSDHWRLWGRQNGQVVVLRMQIGSRPLHLDATLEAPVVAAVGGVLDLQVVDTVPGPEVNSRREAEVEEEEKKS